MKMIKGITQTVVTKHLFLKKLLRMKRLMRIIKTMISFKTIMRSLQTKLKTICCIL